MVEQRRQRRLDKNADPAQQKKQGGQPGLGRRQAAHAPQHMEEPALRKGDQARDGLTLSPAKIDPTVARQPETRCAERDAERLVPPPAPEARDALVEDVGDEGAVDARVVPQFAAGAAREEDAREEEVGCHLPQGHDQVDGDEDGAEADEAVVEHQEDRGQGGEEGREGKGVLCPGTGSPALVQVLWLLLLLLEGRGGGELGPEDKVGVFHHEHAQKIQREVTQNHEDYLGAQPFCACSITTVALACH